MGSQQHSFATNWNRGWGRVQPCRRDRNRPVYDGPGNRNYGHGTRNTTEAQKISQMGAHCLGERGATAVLWDPGMVERKSARRIVVDRCTAATHPRSGTHVRRVPG